MCFEQTLASSWQACRTDPHPTQDASEGWEADSRQPGRPPLLQPASLLIQLAQLSVFNYPGPVFRAQLPPPLQTLPKALLNLSIHCLQGRRQPSFSPLLSSQPATKLPGAEARATAPSAAGLSAALARVAVRRGERGGKGGEQWAASEGFVSAEDLSVRAPRREEGLPGDTAERALRWEGAGAGSPRARARERDDRLGKAGKETKGPGVAGEGDSWRTVSNREAPGRPPYCIGVNNKRPPVPRAASDSPCSSSYFSFLYPPFSKFSLRLHTQV